MNNSNHVGRPTNEEVRLRKKKQMLKICVPAFIIVVLLVLVLSGFNLTGLMGNSVVDYYYSCDEGWFLEDDNTCSMKYEEPAYLLGDTNHDTNITLRDFQLIYNAVKTKRELTEQEELVYDINQDGKVNEEDRESFADVFGRIGTSTAYGFSTSSSKRIYVCPRDKQEEDIKTTYDLDGDKCVVYKIRPANKIYLASSTANDATSSDATSSNATSSNATSSNVFEYLEETTEISSNISITTYLPNREFVRHGSDILYLFKTNISDEQSYSYKFQSLAKKSSKDSYEVQSTSDCYYLNDDAYNDVVVHVKSYSVKGRFIVYNSDDCSGSVKKSVDLREYWTRK